jgi:DNA mismatch repair protein MutS
MNSGDGVGPGSVSTFQSVLFGAELLGVNERLEEPDFFTDLHLDQVVAAVTAGREAYDLEQFFNLPLRDVEAVQYRHHVLRDLDQGPVLDVVREFARGLQEMRKHLGLVEKLHYALQKQRWFLEAVSEYCQAVEHLTEQLPALSLQSTGFVEFRDYMACYAGGDEFTRLATETREVIEELAAVRYAVQVKGNRVRVTRYDGEADMSEEVQRTFEKFKDGDVADYRVQFRGWPI